jgi:PAS domain S-box-containing protein
MREPLRRLVPSLRASLWLLALLALLPAAGLVLWSAAERRARDGDAAREDGLRVARMAGVDYERKVGATREVLATLAGLPEVRGPDPVACAALLRDLHVLYGCYADLGVVSADGRTSCTAVAQSEPLQVNDPECFRRALSSGGFTVGAWQPRAAEGRSTVSFAQPVKDEELGTRAVVYAILDLGCLGTLAARAHLPADAALELFDARGVVLARHPGAKAWVGRQLPQAAAILGVLGNGREGSAEVEDEAGVARLHSVVRVAEPEASSALVLGVSIPAARAYAAANRDLVRGLVVLGFVGLVSLAAAWWIGRTRVLKPVRHLVSVASRVASGDTEARANGVARGSELGDLSRAFDLMAATIATRHTALDRRVALLRESDERREAVLETTHDGSVVVDRHGRVLEFSPKAERTFGFVRPEVVGREFLPLLVPPGLRTRFRRRLTRAVEGRAPHVLDRPLETEAVRKDGVRVPIELTVTRVPGEGPPRLAAYVRDLTARKRLQDELLQAQKREAVGRLVGGIAHDFNNSLTAITGFSQLVLGRLEPEDPVHASVVQIRRAADRAAKLTRQLLAFSRRQVLEPVALDLDAAVRDMAGMLKPLIGENIELRIVRGEGVGYVRADPGQIEQVLVNLVVNARDAMPRGGRITVSTRNDALDADQAAHRQGARAGEHVVLSVADTGMGMTKEVKERIFEPFFTTKERGKGTGLGLATCHGIVEQSGGHVVVESAPGHGSTFEVWLPRVEEAPKHVARREETEAQPRGTETILVAEDEPAVRDVAFQVLRDLGYTVLTAADGVEALGAVKAHGMGGIDLVFTDVVMPRLGGWELSVSLKTILPKVRVLMTSAFMDDTALDYVLSEPGIAFLPKPYTPEGLARKVRQVLDALPPPIIPYGTATRTGEFDA